ncbi:MAG: mechanosensitive ion channel [Clostridia bacterium]|nr:mechanosensitive ion channel [Clostridia bacterium]
MDWNAILTNVVNVCIDVAFKLLLSAVVFFVGRFIIKLVVKFFPNSPKHNHIDPTARTFIESFIKIALNCVLIVTIIAIMGVPMASVLTVFATAGAAIALAVQGSFSNMMGGIMLLIFRPISKGDYVDIDGKAGTVNEIGIFYTQLKTPDNLTVSIPNGTMTSSTIVNYSREENRRVDVTVDVSYETDIDKAREVLAGIVESCEFALKDPKPAIVLSDMADSSIQFAVRVWAPASKYHATKEYLLETSLLALDKAGIEIPYNKLDVNVITNK